MLTVGLILVIAAMAAVAATAVPLVGGRYRLPPARCVLVGLIPLWQMAMMAMSVFAGATRGVGVMWVPLCELIVAALGFACAVFNPRLFSGIEQAGAENGAVARAAALEGQVEVQKAYLEEAERAAVEAVQSRLVYADEFARIAETLAAGDMSSALQAVSRADVMIPRTGRRLCQNPVVDALLKAKVVQAREEGLELAVSAQVPYDLRISDAELCAVTTNLVNNALEAAAHVAQAAKGESCAGEKGPAPQCVSVAMRVVRDSLVIRVENPYLPGVDAGPAVRFGGRNFLQTLGAGGGVPEHGWGLSIVREIAEMRHGALALQQERGMFRATAVLKLDEAAAR